LGEPIVRRVVTLTCAEPPGEVTHWTGPAMARHTGVSLRSVQRATLRGDHRRSPLGASRGRTHDLQPHRIRTFEHSTDPEFAARLEDIVGLYVDPSKHAFVLSVDPPHQQRRG
jgi:hypothetical protein